MYVVVISKPDRASINIRDRLFEFPNWSKDDTLKFDGNDVYHYKDLSLLVTINEYHLFFDDIDQHLSRTLEENGLKLQPQTFIFASKHRSASGKRTLTLHPVGNYHKKADYGGRAEELVPTAPHQMSEGYRLLLRNTLDEYDGKPEHELTFEVTHHGPYLNTPSFFIEIGSDEAAWEDSRAGKVIAKTILDIFSVDFSNFANNYPIAIGIGGGHYAPRHSDVTRKKKISIGHMIPNYALEGITDNMLMRAIERTPGAKVIYFHRKALKKERYRELKNWYHEKGFESVRSDDLEDLD